MDTEYFRADDLITLTQGEWQELVSSIQNLVQANSALLQTVSELMAQRNQAISKQAVPSQAVSSQAVSSQAVSSQAVSSQASTTQFSVPPADPYDLRALNHLLTDTP